MSQRVSMKLYRFQSLPALTESLVNINLSSWDYLQNKNESNIVFSLATAAGSNVVGYINLDRSDIPLDNITLNTGRTFAVKKETVENRGVSVRYYVEVASKKFYFKKSQDNTDVSNSELSMFEFYVNPQRVKPVYNKLITERRTRGGWEIQHWGNALTEISVSGQTGGLHRDITRSKKPGGLGETLLPGESITESTAWKKLNQLRQYYELDRSLANKNSNYKLGFNFYDRFYIGYFTSFEGPEADANSPYLMNYSFNFKVEQEINIGGADGQFGSILNVDTEQQS